LGNYLTAQLEETAIRHMLMFSSQFGTEQRHNAFSILFNAWGLGRNACGCCGASHAVAPDIPWPSSELQRFWSSWALKKPTKPTKWRRGGMKLPMRCGDTWTLGAWWLQLGGKRLA